MHPLIAEFFNDDFLNNKERYSQDQVDNINEECLEHMFALEYEDLKSNWFLCTNILCGYNGDQKELFQILFDIIYVEKNNDKIILNDDEITNILPYVVYKK